MRGRFVNIALFAYIEYRRCRTVQLDRIPVADIHIYINDPSARSGYCGPYHYWVFRGYALYIVYVQVNGYADGNVKIGAAQQPGAGVHQPRHSSSVETVEYVQLLGIYGMGKLKAALFCIAGMEIKLMKGLILIAFVVGVYVLLCTDGKFFLGGLYHGSKLL